MDREKVIKGLEDLRETIRTATQYTFTSGGICAMNMKRIDNAIDLIKEQEAPSKEELISHYGKMYKCKRCGLEWYQQTQKYCQECGTAVKWE